MCQVGIDFDTSSQEAIGLFRPRSDGGGDALARLADSGVSELAMVATCHRVELYAAAVDPRRAVRALTEQLNAMRSERERDELSPAVRLDAAAMHHLIQVAAGLKSARLGEYEILGQVRRAHHAAREADTAGPILDRMFQQAISAAREIRNALGISHQKRSLTDTAMGWLRAAAPPPRDCAAVVVGAGETAREMAEKLAGMGVGELTVLNRTVDRAERMAARVGGRGGPLTRLPAAARDADIVVCAMSGDGPVLHLDHLAAADDRERLVVDLGVPRNTEQSIGSLPNVRLLDMRAMLDLAIGEDGQHQEWADQAADRLDAEAEKFAEWCRTRSISPVFQELRHHYEDTIKTEAERALDHAGLPEDDINQFASRLSGKLLHTFYAGLKEIAVENSPQVAHEITRQLVLRETP
ncbi:glutamyl-tRNA reductase [Actinosynnema sp. CS-041913]|uniref:glutamyl-tRNA reductase n=1 Tax=Actinosynnema sp. CS-041913 TaxID=3239917 RepID=UPI003D8A8C28